MDSITKTKIKDWFGMKHIPYHYNIPVYYNNDIVGKCDYIIPGACILFTPQNNLESFTRFIAYLKSIIPDTYKVYTLLSTHRITSQLEKIEYQEYPYYIGKYTKMRSLLKNLHILAPTSKIYYDERIQPKLYPEELINFQLLKETYLVIPIKREHLCQYIEFTKSSQQMKLTNDIIQYKIFNIFYSKALSSYDGYDAEQKCKQLLKQQNIPYHQNVVIQYGNDRVQEFDFIIPTGCIEVKKIHDNVSLCIFLKKCKTQLQRQLSNMPPNYKLYFYLPNIDPQYITDEIRTYVNFDSRVELISGNYQFNQQQGNYYIDDQNILNNIVQNTPSILKQQIIYISPNLNHSRLFNCSFDYIIGIPPISIIIGDNIDPVQKIFPHEEFPKIFNEYTLNIIDIEYSFPENVVYGFKYISTNRSTNIKNRIKCSHSKFDINRENIYNYYTSRHIPVKFVKLKNQKNIKEFILIPGALICYSTVDTLNNFMKESIKKLAKYKSLIPDNVQLYVYFSKKMDYTLPENDWAKTCQFINDHIPKTIVVDNLDNIKYSEYFRAVLDKKTMRKIIKNQLAIEYVDKETWNILLCHTNDEDYELMKSYQPKYISINDIEYKSTSIDSFQGNYFEYYVSNVSTMSSVITSQMCPLYYKFETKLVEGTSYRNKYNKLISLNFSFDNFKENIPFRVIDNVSYRCDCGNIVMMANGLCPCHLLIFSPTEEKRRSEGKTCWNDKYKQIKRCSSDANLDDYNKKTKRIKTS